ncbi:mismatch-specific DNA-glycosylase [Tropicimonas sp. IMCC34043]|uniref:mismatch-specific DNA-glycosylase n=1 Tax=Tropicimonas sp. IMCC34043 TaxID=2248760 RepID=UPI000E274684|nr:mismatch-specific DNA-glycosylase [Tropicimonas sp. IMCC34043]
MLPDHVAPNLRSVICGTAAGRRSGEIGAYYAGRGNKFWPVLFRAGLVPEPLSVGDELRLLGFGIGLTDLAKGVSGADAAIPAAAYDPGRLAAFLRQHRPQSFAFNGKNAAKRFLQRRHVDYGPIEVGGMAMWILPSTSGAASGSWDEEVWRAFARFLHMPDPGGSRAVSGAIHPA